VEPGSDGHEVRATASASARIAGDGVWSLTAVDDRVVGLLSR
jgi:hypothetical protein